MRPRLASLLVLALACFGLWASTASAAGHAFTPQRPVRDEVLRHGKLSTQVNFRRGPAFQWGYQLNAATYDAATGPMTEDADLYCNGHRVRGYHDHHVVPAPYLVHSSYKPLRTSCSYQLAINESFPIRGGERLVYTRFNFYISYA